MKKHILKSNFSEDTVAFGIVTSNSELQLTMILNQECNFNLQVSEPIEKNIKNKLLHFPCSSENRDDTLKIQLIKNVHLGFVLLNTFKDIDYFLVLSGDFAEEYIKSIQEQIRNCQNIALINSLNEPQIKKMRSLLQIT